MASQLLQMVSPAIETDCGIGTLSKRPMQFSTGKATFHGFFLFL
jgi:hypothetical protein